MQTLDERSYQKMRDASIAILRAIGGRLRWKQCPVRCPP
nr:hypothetical protein [uncultured Sphaerochaeta sp.]